jgi:hypothetical protein
MALQFSGISHRRFLSLTGALALSPTGIDSFGSPTQILHPGCNSALGDVGVTKFTSDSLTIRAATPSAAQTSSKEDS